jgi:hypothetical protein
MKSENHQYIEFSDQVLKRYVKTRLEPITGFRLNPRNSVNPNERISFLLATPEDNVQYTPYGDGNQTQLKQTAFTYEDEVLELYTETEVRAFERMNRLLIENGLLAEYSDTSPEVDKTNAISDAELRKIALTKTTALFQEKVSKITSVHILNALLDLMETLDNINYTHIKLVRSRLNELNTK